MIKLKLKNSIGIRLLRYVFGCYLFVTIVVTCIQLYLEYATTEKRLLTEIHNVGSSFEEGLQEAVWRLDNEAVTSILRGILEVNVVDMVVVSDPTNNIIAQLGDNVTGTIEEEITRVIDYDFISAQEIKTKNKHDDTSFYYKLSVSLFHQDYDQSTPRQIGTLTIYANSATVASRFQESFLLIIGNAIIKTFFLWLIFLYFSQRFISRPLENLTNATHELLLDNTNDSVYLKNLHAMANHENKNEIQKLSITFLNFRKEIKEKLNNMHTLNQFAITMAQIRDRDIALTTLLHFCDQQFSVNNAFATNKENKQIWESNTNDNETLSTNEKILATNSISKNNASYKEIIITSLAESSPTSSQAHKNRNILYISLPDSEHLFLVGNLTGIHIQQETKEISKESMTFLQIISSIIGDALLGIEQNRIIEEQKQTLELRVEKRTQELKHLNNELRFNALHDPLTQLPNRTLFYDRMQQIINSSPREKKNFAVASIDLTRFKQINDTYGHDAGDTVLKEVASRFAHALRAGDTLARMGGDEFAALLVAKDIEKHTHTVSERLIESLGCPIILDNGTCVSVNTNIGLSLFPEHASKGETLFKYADIAMYQAKREGKHYAIFDSKKNTEENEFLQFMNDLEKAVKNDEFELHYQPIFDLKTGKPSSVEALIRWYHPNGEISPGKFIPHAEQSTLIQPITYWVIEQACKQCMLWHSQGYDISISINISTRIFNSPEFCDHIINKVAQYDIDPHFLRLEITESAAMSQPEQALKLLHQLSDAGFTIAIDDFGTGHSSLSYLTRLPVDELKIDKSFIIDNKKENRAIVKAIVELAHTLRFKVVAEGIEDEEALLFLNELGCDSGQGFYLCRPCNAAAVEEQLRTCQQIDNQNLGA